jgi:hypothetical protein|tara:strand:- start:42 stop:248 length:207 start_codon:yes stop_codon:yes gene_type:complete
MTEDKVIENFSKMFPNCPDPEHQPRVVEYLVKVFKHVEEQRVKRELLEAQAIKDSKKESVDDEESIDE